MTYEVGDNVGIFPQHDPDLVAKTLKALRIRGNEQVYSKTSGQWMSLTEFLTSKGNITTVSPKLFREVYLRHSDQDKKQQLSSFLEEAHSDALRNYLNQYEVWDFLAAHSEVHFKPQELVDLLMPLLPRFYSISSSQKYVGEEIHLTVTPLEYELNGHQRRGVCTHYLCHLVDLQDPVVPIFIQPSHGFHLPEDLEASLIMIGPGTGVAPFRAFLQERLLHYQSNAKHWLFFGEWNRAYHFFYEEEWAYFGTKGHLRLDLAFSRDQDYKIYVQHKMQEWGKELYHWLEEGAYLYVCGDARRMAKDVEAVLHMIIQEQGSKDILAAKEYLKHLRQQKRYLRDVY